MVRQPPAPATVPARSYSAYYQRIERYAHRIRKTDNVMSIIDILDQALTETRALENHGDGQIAPGKITHAELEIQSLKTELEQLRGLVHVDHLTGMQNRGGLNDSFAREAARADRAGTLLAVALLDIDDFKSLNDQYGHQAGDDALVHLASIIRGAMRPSDIVVRFGGEEFLFVLPDANAEQAVQALLRIQHDLDRQPLIHRGQEITLTFSAGIAIRSDNESRDAVIARADAAMYMAKRAGKRQVCKAH
ncbi:MAG: GGDEF domain-containing protein [Burkholderiales bacterium]